ncbi:hypothetical protein [Psychromonas sp. SA13A]|uniref:hypothetical protein n=1 Tax=Psychromonas sp. SA13A TaxID=2686346 RepID=UPI0014092C0D|nr:hypothetical protein [Psychromonas sp. SA13A]
MKKLILIALVLLSGCKTIQEIEQGRKVEISNMDNLDVCFNLGMQEDFEYWKMIKDEQFRRKDIPNGWDVSEELCSEAKNFGRGALVRHNFKKQEAREDMSNAIQEAGNAVSKGYDNAAKAYGSVKRSNCQTVGNITNCTIF